MTATQTLAEFVAATRLRDIPADVVARAGLILADCVGCIAAGSTVPEVQRLLRLQAAPDAGELLATALGTPTRLAASSAAFVNGAAGTWHDLDEGNLSTRTHAAIQIVPAAFAECEARCLSGTALLEALILGYEASARIWRATESRLAAHPHGTYGPLAAAFALAKLRGDDVDAIARAVNIAATLGIAASRATLTDGATVRNIYSGHSGRAAYEALALRDAGFTGEADAVSSIFGNLYGSSFNPKLATDDLGSTWWMRRNYFKRFAAGRYAHGALDLVEELASRRIGLAPDSVERIEVQTFFMAATLGHQTVRTPFGCRFSIPMLVAQRIARGRMPLTDDCTHSFSDETVRVLARRVFVSENPAATAAYPERQPTRMTVFLRDGTSHTASCERILGESDHPLSIEALEAKFMELAQPVWGIDAQSIWSDLIRIGDFTDVGGVVARWQKAAADNQQGGRP
jgi:2-methylcitrate dehydratase PrpD